MTLLSNRELVSIERNYVWLVFSQILSKIVQKIRNIPKISLRSFENVAPVLQQISAETETDTSSHHNRRQKRPKSFVPAQPKRICAMFTGAKDSKAIGWKR